MKDKMTSEKRVSYTAQNSYSTFGHNAVKTKNIWLVFHGLGHLSRYFTKHFSILNPEENFVIAPQAPSKYYQGTEYKHVGASWLTKEDTLAETENVMQYVDAVWQKEVSNTPLRLIVVGYSQGVSIATRWLSSRKIECDHLVLHSGGIPIELKATDFEYLPSETEISLLYGDKDPYINETRVKEEKRKAEMLFGNRLQIQKFEGVHEVYNSFFTKIA